MLELDLSCEFVHCGPPEPMRLVLQLSRMEWEVGYGLDPGRDGFSVSVVVEFPWTKKEYQFGTERRIVALFVSDLRKLLDPCKGSAVLHQEADEENHLKVQAEDPVARTFLISGQFYEMPTCAKPGPEEADLFANLYALACGFRGVRVQHAELARALGELEVALPTL